MEKRVPNFSENIVRYPRDGGDSCYYSLNKTRRDLGKVPAKYKPVSLLIEIYIS